MPQTTLLERPALLERPPVRVRIGRTSLGEPIDGVRFGDVFSGERVSAGDGFNSTRGRVCAGRRGGGTLILGGIHGDEPKSVDLCRRLVERLEFASEPESVSACVVSVVNPDGFGSRRRTNASGIDLNRNFPTQDWVSAKRGTRYDPGAFPASEPETRAIIHLIERMAPSLVIAVHSISKGLFCNNYDGPAEPIARRLAGLNSYPVTSTIGYPTRGSLGTWVGVERRIPIVTLELPSHHSSKRTWRDNGDALVELCHRHSIQY